MKSTCIFALLLTISAYESRGESVPIGNKDAAQPSAATELPAPIRGKNYQLVFEDAFDGPAGTAPDPAKWKPIMPGKWRDAWNVEDAARLDGKGNLVITVRRNGERIETGYIGTPGKFEATHGYFEVRCRVLNTKGAWCAFWVQSSSMGDPVGDASRAGVELDVIEYFGPHWEHKDHVRHTAHWDGYGKDHKAEGVGKPYPEITKRFCTFAMKWDSEGYIFYADGVESARLKEAPMSNRPQHLLLSCEVEKWCGNIAEAVLPDTFTIDHVRVWQTPVQIEADAKRPTILTATAAKALLDRRGYFGWLDKNGDKELSMDEFQSDRKDKQDGEKAFAGFDRNKDGRLSPDEFLFSGDVPPADIDRAIEEALAADKVQSGQPFKE